VTIRLSALSRGAKSDTLEWQAGYGVVSFGTRDLDWVRSYVRNQRERHASGKIEDRLARTAAPETEGQAEPREAP